MIAEKLELKNFGKHAHLIFDCDASITGIVGENGTGKSTVLDALEFAITGRLRDNQESYVRNLDGNASVHLIFRKNAKRFEIFRQIGKSSKRSLKIENEDPITSAKKIDETMAQIFRADKEAISNAVFINQGTLDNILFSQDTARKLLFIRLVNMSYCDARAKIVERRIKTLNANVVDLTAAKDAAQQNKETADFNLGAKKRELDETPDPTHDLKLCEDVLRDEERIGLLNAQIAENQLQLQQVRGELETSLKSADMTEIGQLRQYAAGLETELKLLRETVTFAQTTGLRLNAYQRVKDEETQAKEALDALQKSFLEVNPERKTIPLLVEELARLDHDIQRARRRDYLRGEQDKWLAEIGRLTNEITTAAQHAQQLDNNPATSRATLATLRSTVQLAQFNLDQSRQLYANRQEMLENGCIQAGDTHCKKCGLQVVDSSALTPEGMASLEQDIRQATEDLANTSKMAISLEATWKTADQVLERLNVENRKAIETEAAVNDELNNIELISSEVELRASREARTELKRFLTEFPDRLRQATLRHNTAKADLTSYQDIAEIIQTGRQEEFSNQAVAQRKAELATAEETAKSWQDFLQGTERLADTILNLSKVIERAEAEINRINGQERTVTPLVERYLAQDGEAKPKWRQCLEEMRSLQTRRDQALGAYREADANALKATAAFNDLVLRMQKDELRVKLIKDLEALKEMLSNDGLPMAVVRFHFEHLAALTQEFLGKLNANFQIAIDRGGEISFTFTRLDEPEAVELPMQKLSGGQRVKLCLAFLMACQRRLVKDVGLLVLDEPSVHVDEAGIESIIDMLQDLGRALQETDHQVVVVDHDPSMARAFGKMLQLK